MNDQLDVAMTIGKTRCLLNSFALDPWEIYKLLILRNQCPVPIESKFGMKDHFSQFKVKNSHQVTFQMHIPLIMEALKLLCSYGPKSKTKLDGGLQKDCIFMPIGKPRCQINAKADSFEFETAQIMFASGLPNRVIPVERVRLTRASSFKTALYHFFFIWVQKWISNKWCIVQILCLERALTSDKVFLDIFVFFDIRVLIFIFIHAPLFYSCLAC